MKLTPEKAENIIIVRDVLNQSKLHFYKKNAKKIDFSLKRIYNFKIK